MSQQLEAPQRQGRPKASDELLVAARDARARATRWLTCHVSSNGEPHDAEARSGWPRVGWALAISGQPETGARVVEWAGTRRIAHDGGFVPGFTSGQGYISSYPLYWLGSYVISAWMTGRIELAMRSMAFIRSKQDSATGGMPMSVNGDVSPICDMLSTAQSGLTALVVGDHEVAHGCAHWVRSLARQDARESLLFHACQRGEELWTDPDDAHVWSAINDFSKPRQAFYPPGMGAVFLAQYAQRYRCEESLRAAARLLEFNRLGHRDQFDDVESVQACKFGWAVAEMYLATLDDDWLQLVHDMTGWFLKRQGSDGAWGPSKFADPTPSVADQMVKTSEHLMELSRLTSALGTAQAR